MAASRNKTFVINNYYCWDDVLKIVEDKHSCIHKRKIIKHIALLPAYMSKIKSGILSILNQELLHFIDELEGIFLAYNNKSLKLITPHGLIVDSQPHLHFKIQLEVLIFQPVIDCILKGTVNKIGTDYIGCLVHKVFNASIYKPDTCGSEWRGFGLQIGEEFLFTVIGFEYINKLLHIKGQLYENTPLEGI